MVYVMFPYIRGTTMGASLSVFKESVTGCCHRIPFIITLSCGAEETMLGKALSVRVHSWVQKASLSA